MPLMLTAGSGAAALSLMAGGRQERGAGGDALNRHYRENSTKWHSRGGSAASCFPKAGIKQTRRQYFANNLICLML